MAVKLTCPRCKTPLQVPTKMLGQYTQCPACQGRILIPPQAPAAAGAGDSGSSAAVHGTGVDTAAGFNRPAPLPTSQGPAFQSPAAEHPGAAPVMPAAVWSDHAAASSPPQRKVARFITADSAPSTVQLAPNGELPKLQLAEGTHAQKNAGKSTALNPLVLVGAASLSFCLCIALLLVDFDTTAVDTGQEANVRRQLESYYLNQEIPLAPYQSHLREAEQARSRGDREAERRHYRKVLDLLHAERDPRDRFRGLTGTPQQDKKLEALLATLLAGQQADSGDEAN